MQGSEMTCDGFYLNLWGQGLLALGALTCVNFDVRLPFKNIFSCNLQATSFKRDELLDINLLSFYHSKNSQLNFRSYWATFKLSENQSILTRHEDLMEIRIKQ